MRYRYRILLFLASGLLTGAALAHWANFAHSQAPPDSLQNVRRDLTTNVRQVNAQGQEIADIQSDNRQQDIDIRILQEDSATIRTNVGTWQSQHNDLKNLVEDRLQRIDALPVTEQGEAIAAVRESAGVNAEAITLMQRTLMAVDSDIGNMDIFNPDNPPSAEAIADWRGGVEDGSLPLAQRSLLHGLDIETNAEGVAANVEGIANNLETLNAHDGRITTNAEGITTNAEGVAANVEGIANNLETLNAHDGRITTNAEGITTNAEGVAANLQTLGEHDTRIGTNAQNIGVLDRRTLGQTDTLELMDTTLVRLDEGVVANLETLSVHDTRIGANADGVAANLETLGAHDTRITTNAEGVFANVETLGEHDTRITTNAEGMFANLQTLDEHDTRIGTNAEGVAANLQTLDEHDTRITTNAEGVFANLQTLDEHDTRIGTNAEGVAANLQTLGEHDTRITANAEGVTANELSIGDMGILDRREVENEDGEMVAAVAFDEEQREALQESYDQGTADIATNLYVNRERLDKHDALINTNMENIGILDDRTLAHGETLKSHGATLEKHGQRLDAVEDGVSMSMALSALDTRPGAGENFRVGAGVGMAGSAAVAVGGTGRIMKHGAWNLGVSTTGSEVGARVGLNWGF